MCDSMVNRCRLTELLTVFKRRATTGERESGPVELACFETGRTDRKLDWRES
jgi:hypothetical protein